MAGAEGSKNRMNEDNSSFKHCDNFPEEFNEEQFGEELPKKKNPLHEYYSESQNLFGPVLRSKSMTKGQKTKPLALISEDVHAVETDRSSELHWMTTIKTKTISSKKATKTINNVIDK